MFLQFLMICNVTKPPSYLDSVALLYFFNDPKMFIVQQFYQTKGGHGVNENSVTREKMKAGNMEVSIYDRGKLWLYANSPKI